VTWKGVGGSGIRRRVSILGGGFCRGRGFSIADVGGTEEFLGEEKVIEIFFDFIVRPDLKISLVLAGKYTRMYLGGAGATPVPRGAEKACASRPSVRFKFSAESSSDSSESFPPIILVNNDPFLSISPQ